MVFNLTEFFILFLSILICELAGVFGLIFNIYGKSSWYVHLKKPDFNPPDWVFGYVWVSLYFLMGISLYLVWSHGIDFPKVAIALKLFGMQLVLNTMWSIVFFGFRYLFGGFVLTLILFASILLTIINFFPISQIAALLLIPYLLWVGFAAILCYKIWKLNRSPINAFS